MVWGSLSESENNFTSPYLLSFDDVEKLSNCHGTSVAAKNVKTESVMTTQMMPVSYFKPDILTQHNIQLIQYSRQMKELSEQISNSYSKTNLDSIPPVPLMPARQPIQPNNSIKLTRRGAQQLLHKSVFHICAHEGFDATTESVLSTLADATEEMLIQFCKLLKVNTEREMLDQSTGFSDPMERTLHDIGFNGIKDLQDFYVTRVKCYNGRLRQDAERLHQSCIQAGSQWKNKSSGISNSWEDSEWTEWSGNETHDPEDSFKKESSNNFTLTENSNGEAVHQLHLEDNVNVSAPGLEPGLRMLHTLEQQEAACLSLKRLELESDDSNAITVSPQIPDSKGSHDLATSSSLPSSKNGNKKRKKN